MIAISTRLHSGRGKILRCKLGLAGKPDSCIIISSNTIKKKWILT